MNGHFELINCLYFLGCFFFIVVVFLKGVDVYSHVFHGLQECNVWC